jgi:hypothetical protein
VRQHLGRQVLAKGIPALQVDEQGGASLENYGFAFGC